MLRILTVVGARPQFVKAAVVSAALRRQSHEEIVVHTGQHYDANMSDVFFEELGMSEPDVHLGIGSGEHGEQTGRMLAAVEQVIQDRRPSVVLVYGDTNSTLAGALAAAKLHIPVAHVEAGLRSFNRRMPEEINRVLTDHLSTLLFAPTDAAVRNLRAEGIRGARVVRTGDVMYDVTLSAKRQASERTILSSVGVTPGHYVLATVHRAENTDDLSRLKAILEALNRLSVTLPVVLPLHPRTRAVLAERAERDSIDTTGIRLIEPVGYLDMCALEAGAKLIVTDSGGVQKEAFFHQVPCVTLRDETEWVELVSTGWNRLVSPASAYDISTVLQAALEAPLPEQADLYGDGHASDAIVDHLERAL